MDNVKVEDGQVRWALAGAAAGAAVAACAVAALGDARGGALRAAAAGAAGAAAGAALGAMAQGRAAGADSGAAEEAREEHLEPVTPAPFAPAKPAPVNAVRVAFGTTTGKARACARWTEAVLGEEGLDAKEGIDVVDLAEYDQDNLEQEDVVVFVVSTWTGGTPPESCRVFFTWLEDMAADFRVDKARFLSQVRFAVIGLGNRDYESEFFCSAADRLDTLMAGLGATRLAPVAKLDDSVNLEPQLRKVATALAGALVTGTQLETTPGETKAAIQAKMKAAAKARVAAKAKAKADQAAATEDEVKGDAGEEDEEEDEEDRINNMMLTVNQTEEELGDMEDIIVVGTGGETSGAPREMVTNSQRKALTKEGYKIIGTHSAVKICRWTKHHLRGRGGCYKHTFYGITSYQCMEATPSLACANKCVFCWRHHKNPVGKEWRWKQDEPDMIVREAISLHQGMIKQMKGVPGVQPDRLKAAFTVRHCALSLVGEPIMYPRINEMVQELHDRSISTFLVTNAQFPQAIKDLSPVTQLYVSVDAANKDALKEVDRPLFKDFWERFRDSLMAIRAKGQRTVYRLTLVKQWNMMEEELDEWVQLLELGQPDFIEIKAVTYCGKSDASNLTMQNVPWHSEVRKFAAALCERTGGRYGTACEHVHSCCTLLALKDPYLVDGRWHTWIDYDKFHELERAHRESNGAATFEAREYMAPTPDWAVWGAEEEGFDPVETRFRRSRAAKKEGSKPMPPAGLPASKKASQDAAGQ